ncbi:DUF3237 domain-containing protein [Bremerella cremea]|uniref:UPF0311 protein DTL42_06900 n=2 Tax=Bremerella cremea TaxID=1031537 RepID=A0A368KZ38_9BACT|nr:DUF3237 domain-containing protein [Bremerella cremea]
MWYVPELLGELAAARGIEGHQLLGLQKLGASRTLQHWQLPDGDNKAKQALKTGQVGVFVMSPIQLPDEGLENFVKLGLQHNPDMRFLVQLSWGGGDIDNQEFPKGAWSVPDRNKTPEQLAKMNVPNIKAGEAQIKELNKRYGKGKDVVFLIPTAQAAAELRSRIYRKEIPGLTSQDELFVDPAHPSPPLEALNTYLHYAVLYQESPVGLPMIDLLKRANRPEWDEKLNRTLQEIAWQTARNYPYSGIKEPKSSQVSGSLPAEKSFAVPELELVYTSYVDIGKPLHVGKMPEGERRVIPITGGTFKGPKMQGEIIPGGADWNLSRADGATVAEANYFLRTDDGVVIRISNWGVGAPPTGLRFTNPRFEAPHGKYDWLNQSVFVGTLDVDFSQPHPICIRVFCLK